MVAVDLLRDGCLQGFFFFTDKTLVFYKLKWSHKGDGRLRETVTLRGWNKLIYLETRARFTRKERSKHVPRIDNTCPSLPVSKEKVSHNCSHC